MEPKIFLFVLTALVGFSSCLKRDDTASFSSGQTKLYRIYAEGQLQSEYIYDPDGLLIKHVLYGIPAKKTGEDSFFYDANRRFLKKETSVDLSSFLSGSVWSHSYTEYNYDTSGKISEEKTYLLTNNIYKLASKTKPAYDANGRIISQTIFLPDDTPSFFTSYQYNSQGNIVFQEEYGYNNTARERHFTYSYDYDNKKNPYRNISWSVPPFSVNQNNILQTTVTNFITPGTPVVTVKKTEFKSYNSKEMPVKVFENGTNFIYEYK